MKITSNIGKTGVESIRLGGMTLDDLPMAEAAHAKEQIPIYMENERKQKVKTIRAEYPTQSVDYINACIRESEENVKRVMIMRKKETELITEYTSIIALCKHRDTQISKLIDKAEIKELFDQYPPYNVDAMQQQIDQSTDSINRADKVIAKEYSDIATFRELVGICQQRDIELRKLGEN